MAPRPLPQSWSSPSPPAAMAPSNGTTPPKLVVFLPPNHSTQHGSNGTTPPNLAVPPLSRSVAHYNGTLQCERSLPSWHLYYVDQTDHLQQRSFTLQLFCDSFRQSVLSQPSFWLRRFLSLKTFLSPSTKQTACSSQNKVDTVANHNDFQNKTFQGKTSRNMSKGFDLVRHTVLRQETEQLKSADTCIHTYKQIRKHFVGNAQCQKRYNAGSN